MKKNLSYVLPVFAMVALMTVLVASTNCVSMLGVSAYAAKKVIDIVSKLSTAAAVISIIATVVASGGVGVVFVAATKSMLKRYAKKVVIAW